MEKYPLNLRCLLGSIFEIEEIESILKFMVLRHNRTRVASGMQIASLLELIDSLKSSEENDCLKE